MCCLLFIMHPVLFIHKACAVEFLHAGTMLVPSLMHMSESAKESLGRSKNGPGFVKYLLDLCHASLHAGSQACQVPSPSAMAMHPLAHRTKHHPPQPLMLAMHPAPHLGP